MKRGLWAFGGGVVVSLVTAIVLPNDRVRYGVLTLIGSCILIWILLDKVLKKIPAGVGVSVSFVLYYVLSHHLYLNRRQYRLAYSNPRDHCDNSKFLKQNPKHHAET